MAEAWLQRAAAEMWARLDPRPAGPPDLEELALFGLSATTVLQPRLTLQGVRDWLQRRDLPAPAAEADRPLRGCLVAWSHSRFVFLDADDAPCEQRYTLAHELAHLWIEIDAPRARARAELGEAVLEVFNGQRPPTATERAYSLFHRLPLGVATHLLARDAALGLTDGAVLLAEGKADRLALELLAPEYEALERLPDPTAWAEWVPEATRTLEREFRLPEGIAREYARRLAPRIGAFPSWRERWSGVR